ncbi:synaptotagmin-14b isoform X1 [Sebastes umbrosus]|uniref:synaptotagmin-14b isoform X1 n=1 Tax=Sebastes umbrosus TaxID=72105 RepID=UPI00189F4017|nr:synaptotagmin-14b isoform X1 [Sebastes umbrosus]XP_037606883.1 synaptotagmin-14b isoform X1 [Sebastes umbrosus]
MAFFKSFQQNLPSVNISSLLDSVTSRVDDLANAVSDATYAVSDQLTEQVTTIINKVEDGENSGQESGQTSTAQEGGSKASNAASKTNQSSDANEAESAQSQLEWEWRDGCWRVKKTEAELAEEEKKKKEEKELQEKKEQRRKERREKQLEKEAEAQKNKEEDGEHEENADAVEKTDDSGDHSTAQQRGDDGDEPPPSPGPETESRSSKQKEEGEAEEEVADSPEREGDDEEEADLARSSSTVKKKKSDKKKKKGAKEGSKKSEEVSDGEKKKEKGKKSKKKKKGKKAEGVLSDSEEDKGPEAVAQQNTTSAWSNKRKPSGEQGGYSSEASSERAINSIQRIKKKNSSLSETQPPPYQDESSAAARVTSRSHSERGVRRGSSPQRCDSPHCSSEASVDQDTESYLNKGCEEDIPSDSTAVLGPEDGSGPQLPTAYEPEPLAKYGTLDVAFEYDSGEQWLAVTVTAATDIPALKQTGNIAWQVHLVLLPTKKQRAKTGVQKGPCPVFTETFKFSRVEQDALGDYAVRFRLYSIRRMKKEKVLGEKVFYLTKLNLQGKIALPVTLEPGSELTGCGSVVSVSRSAGALSYRSTEDSSLPEILVGLLYNSATGQLSAEVIQGSHFKTPASEKPVNGLFCCIKHFVGGQLYIMRDTYVKLTMLDSKGKEMSKCKTAVCRGQPNPTYKETFLFQVALFQLSEVSLVLSVFCRRSSMRPRERLGWVSLGLNSTGEEQQAHWTEMKEAEGQQVCHWHTLGDT